MDAPDEPDIFEAGRQLGHDYYCHSILHRQPDWPVALQEGFDAAAARRMHRRPADRFQRKWLQLRWGAWARGRSVAADVTVDLIRRLDVANCPVTRKPLTHGVCTDTDWSIDRLNNDGAYAAANLAVMSVRANRAKGSLKFEEVVTLTREPQPTSGLSAEEWSRLAVLMLGPTFADRPLEAPVLPLVAPLPVASARMALQQVQRLFTLGAIRPAGKNRLVKDFQPALDSERGRLLLRQLGDAVHEGLKKLAPEQECWDVWLQPAAMQALVRWRNALSELEWAHCAVLSGQLAGARALPLANLRHWHLETRGYLSGHTPRAPTRKPQPRCTPPAT